MNTICVFFEKNIVWKHTNSQLHTRLLSISFSTSTSINLGEIKRDTFNKHISIHVKPPKYILRYYHLSIYIYFKILHTLYIYNLTAYLYKEVVGGIHGHGSYRKDMFLFFTYKRQSIFLWYYYIITETNLKIFSFTLVGPHHQACSNGRYILWFCWLLMKGQIFFV